MQLEEYQRLQTSGARGVTLFKNNDNLYLAIPQLAEDVAGQPADMNGGNSDTYVMIYRWQHQSFQLYQKISSHGAEDVCFTTIGNQPVLAVANIRSGHEPDFNMHTDSNIYIWSEKQFKTYQSIPTFAAKGCHFFHSDNQDYLLLSQGVSLQPTDTEANNSQLFCWDGNQFKTYQSIPGLWGYDIDSFSIDKRLFITLADNLVDSVIYEWKDSRLEPFQKFAENGGGRLISCFVIDQIPYLAVINLLHDSDIYRWDGKQFVHLQTLPGKGGRYAHHLSIAGEHYLIKINFITGPREEPVTEQLSQIYQWQNGKFNEVNTLTTYGGTACHSFSDGKENYLVVSNSLSKNIRFRVDSVVYRIKK